MKFFISIIFILSNFYSYTQNDIKNFKFDYYNEKINLKYNENLSKYKCNLNKESIDIHVQNIKEILISLEAKNQIKEYQDSLQLSDWLTLNLVEYYSYLTKNRNTSVLIRSILLSELGYNIKLKYNKKKAYGFLETIEDESCCFSWIIPDNGKFYIPFHLYYTIPNDYSFLNEYSLNNQEKKFTLLIEKNVNFKTNLVNRSFFCPLSYQQIDISIDETYINILNMHPPIKVEKGTYTKPYKNISISPIIYHFKKEFEEAKIEDSQKLRQLIDFVTLNFDYRKDKKNTKWKDKSFYPDETLYYKSGDCEDLSFLLAYLIRELTDFDVIYLLSEEAQHINIAVKLDSPIGIPYIHNKEKYTVIDPTFFETIDSEIGNQNKRIQELYSVFWESSNHL